MATFLLTTLSILSLLYIHRLINRRIDLENLNFLSIIQLIIYVIMALMFIGLAFITMSSNILVAFITLLSYTTIYIIYKKHNKN